MYYGSDNICFVDFEKLSREQYRSLTMTNNTIVN